MSISLGYAPGSFTVHLTRDGDFIQTFRTKDGSDWPAGTVVTLHVGSASWPATLTGPNGSWNVDKAEVNAQRGATRARITYTSTGTDLTWMVGKVQWHG